VTYPVVSNIGNPNVQYGIGGITTIRCIDGYKFVVGGYGQSSQILDANGKGVTCE
jgi:hypothetical protein